jgi:hypothetical protein
MLLSKAASADLLASHLLQLATDDTGLIATPSLSKCSFDAASALVAIRQDFDNEDLNQ